MVRSHRIARPLPRSAGALFALLLALPCTALPSGIYRWTDANGAVHFGDQPPPGAEVIRPSAPQKGEPVAVKAVLDGDTVQLANGDSVRLIGVNAPEVAKRGQPGEPGGLQAQRFLRELLAGKRVRLLPEEDRRDKYGRQLAHLFLEDGTNVNALLLREGHAFAVALPPNVSRADEYFRVEAEARAAQRGLWALERYQVQPAQGAEEYFNTFRRLRGTVQRVEPDGKGLRIALQEGLDLLIDGRHKEYFNAPDLEPARLQDRTLVARGWVQRRDGRPVIHLEHPRQIEGLEAGAVTYPLQCVSRLHRVAECNDNPT